jgi:hypothetical protein
MSLGKRVSPKAWLSTMLAAVVLAAAGDGVMPATPEDLRLALDVTARNVLDPFDYFSNSWTVIGLKDYPDGTRISPGVEFLLADKAACRILVGENLTPLNGRIKKTLEKGHLPLVRFDFILNGNVEYIVEAFACPLAAAGPEGYDHPENPNFLNLVRITLRDVLSAWGGKPGIRSRPVPSPRMIPGPSWPETGCSRP